MKPKQTESNEMNNSQHMIAFFLIMVSIAIIIGYFSVGLPVWILLMGNLMGVAASMMLKPYVNPEPE